MTNPTDKALKIANDRIADLEAENERLTNEKEASVEAERDALAAALTEKSNAYEDEVVAHNRTLEAKAWLEAQLAERDSLLKESLSGFRHVRVFVTSSERIKKPEGDRLFDELVERIAAALRKDGE